MAFEIVWTDRAKEDLNIIIAYLESNWSEKEIGNFFDRLEECLGQIKKTPHRFKNSLRKEGTKEFQHSPQTTIFYSHDSNYVNILRMWSNIQNPKNLK